MDSNFGTKFDENQSNISGQYSEEWGDTFKVRDANVKCLFKGLSL